MTAEVSVIIPTYNRADLIGETLHSILRQSCSPAEIIVVDDGSSDDTESVVLSLGAKVKYIKIRNSGECRARNVGVTHSLMPLVCYCDSDDLWHPEKLNLQLQLFRENPRLEYSFTNFTTIVDGQWSACTKFDTSPEGY